MKKAEQIIGWILFGVVFAIYIVCSSRTISFWDSAEFVASNYKLQITHPPGAPLYMLISNAILSVVPSSNIAFVNTIISGLFGALTVTLVYFITKALAYSILKKSKQEYTIWLPSVCGIISALTLAFIHSFWVAATETEVYTLSFLLLIFIWYLLILWLKEIENKREVRWLILIAFLLGLSAGVHLINLSVVIPMAIIFVYKKYQFSIKNIILGLVGGTLLFFVIYGVIIQGFLYIGYLLDVFFVNDMSLSVNTGLIVMYILLFLFLSACIWYASRKNNSSLAIVSFCILFFYIGLSSYGVTIIRANAQTPTSNEPTNPLSLLKYIKAEQFGLSDTQLVRGHFFNAPIDKDMPFSDRSPIVLYDKNTKKYVEVDNGVYSKENYAREFTTFFPRMYSRKSADITGYNTWTFVKGTPVSYPIMGEVQQINKPTFSENVSFFYNYQLDWLYLRYLYWNFIGKQNDNKGTGTILNGNWISGIGIVDQNKIGDSEVIPDYYKIDKSKDSYYFLPFLLGLIGLFSMRKKKVHLLTSFVFFLTFGLGIILYVNPTPSSILIRERDYIFIASFIPFCMWIGLASLQLYKWFSFIPSKKTKLIGITVLVAIAGPLQLFAKGWDDHNRSDDTFARDFAKAYLDSCPPNTILITNGDNMTFPLWYLQEVEDYRTDIRIINFDQLNLDWYIEKLKLSMNNSRGLTVTLPKELYQKGPQQVLPLRKEVKDAVDVDLLFKFLADPKTKKPWNRRPIHYIPTDKFYIKIDTLKIPQKHYNKNKLNLSFVDQIAWNFSKDFYAINELATLNIIQQNIHDRPIAFAINGNTNHYIGLQPYTIQQGLVEVLAPVKRSKPGLNPKIVNTGMMFPFLKDQTMFSGFRDVDQFVDYENRAYAQQILRRNYYFLAQALLEENRAEDAIAILDKCVAQFPNHTVPFKQFAFAIGKLYIRAGNQDKGDKICLQSMSNLKEELLWLISFNPDNSIINVRHANRIKGMYIQMIHQYEALNFKKANELKKEFEQIELSFKEWHSKNWPY
ncbi:DUF2723 domain-containing protein [uncultured Aquimarina sp.]|uniref:glycosyltransferase family 117 protein n=1 Tax=uncultured Aquimarina sp. TaxID=575652 RepID=UPI002618BBB5|nr:DUF2723 domain-containing protein [uncultured Aquimarina sp.]